MKEMLRDNDNRIQSKTLWKVGEDLGDLYYTVRFGFTFSQSIPNKLLYPVLELIKFGIDQLLQTKFNNYHIEINESTTEEVDYNYQVSIIIPVKEDFDKIRILEEELSIESNNGLGVYLTLYLRRKLGIIRTFIRWIKKEPYDVYSSTLLINLPWDQVLIDKKNLAGLTPPIPLKHYEIKELSEPINNANSIIVGSIVERTRYGLPKYEFYDSFIIQYFGKTGTKKDRIQQSVDHSIDISVVDIMIDQQYIAHNER